ncbi:MAG: diaminopimelate epimerase [Clostridia bacterium]|nr:diaminopimelate epimerase [Clostridia bacterium]
MLLDFIKMEGAGNDYIYFNLIADNTNEDIIIQNIEKLCDRHFGIGSDGVVFVLKSDISDFKMRMFNSDASEASMCGNAIRCVAKYVYENKYIDKENFSIETLSGAKNISLEVLNKEVINVLVDMGNPEIKSELIPVISNEPTFINKSIYLDGVEYRVTCVSMGNPHAVIFVDNVDNIDIESLGPRFEKNSIFPRRTNTEFVQFLDEKSIKMRVWERGSGETLACGTGACACVVAAVLNDVFKKDQKIKVILKGGTLEITYLSSEKVIMSGPARVCFTGKIEI